MYFLIPAILIVIGLVTYSTFGKKDSETLPVAETHSGHVEGDTHMDTTTTTTHDDSGEAPHAHD